MIILNEDRKNITIRITLSGLNLMYSPMEYYHNQTKHYTPYKVFITNFTQRGMKDTVIHDLKEYEITKDIMDKSKYSIEYKLGDFYAPYYFSDNEEHDFKYDLVENLMFIKIFFVPSLDVLHLNTFDDKLNTVLEYADYTLKVPMATYSDAYE